MEEDYEPIYPSFNDDQPFIPSKDKAPIINDDESIYNDILSYYPNLTLSTFNTIKDITKKRGMEYSYENLPIVYNHIFDPINDNLISLSIMYNVSIESIRYANGLICRDNDLWYYEKKELKIPNPKRIPKCIPKGRLKEQIEKETFAIALKCFKDLKNVSELVAKSYLEMNNNNFHAAIKEYDEDIKWEQEDKKKKEEEKKRKNLLLYNKNPILYFFGQCLGRNQIITD
jgi:hypothetical protein